MNATVKAIITFAAGAAVGTGITYLVVNKKAEAKWQALAEEQIAQVKTRYAAVRKENYEPTVEPEEKEPTTAEKLVASVLEDQNKLLRELGYSEEQIDDYRAGIPEADLSDVVQEVEFQKHLSEGRDEDIPSEEESRETLKRVNSIFDEESQVPEEEAGTLIAEDSDHYRVIQQDKLDGKPYIMHVDEFMEDDSYEKISITYYEGDDVLVDERDMPIDDEEMTVGRDNLERFGWESKDKNIVYVRNDKMEVFFEIARSEQAYTDVVAGVPQSKSSIQKFRNDD